MVERLEEFLLVRVARPGRTHAAFCRVPFDLVCTTNLDFLLEQQYSRLHRHCTPIIDETQLVVNTRSAGVNLLKFHGDLHHPNRLVVTEEDYAGFLSRYPLLATYVANLSITRTLVLIGYSFDDPDLQQLWQVISDRLGKARRDAYALVVDPTRNQVAKYARRGIAVVGIPSEGRNHGAALAKVFDDLAGYWRRHVFDVSAVTEEDSRGELSLPAESPSRLCFFAVPFQLQSLYRRYIFPIARRRGLVPITADDVVTPGETVFAKIEALVSRAQAMVVDVSTEFTNFELALAMTYQLRTRLLVVVESGVPASLTLRGVSRITRRRDLSIWPEKLIDEFELFFRRVREKAEPQLLSEPERLLRLGEYRAAVISAMTLLEARLRETLVADEDSAFRGCVPLSQLLHKGRADELIGSDKVGQVREWMAIRNRAVHTVGEVGGSVAQ